MFSGGGMEVEVVVSGAARRRNPKVGQKTVTIFHLLQSEYACTMKNGQKGGLVNDNK